MSAAINKLIKDSFHVVVSQGITYITSAVWGILLVRWIGPETFGSYIFYTSFFSIIISIFQFGTIAYLSRELNARENSIIDFYIHTNVQINITILLFFTTLLYFAFNNEVLSFTVIGLSSFLLVSGDNISNVLTTYNYSKSDAKFVANVSLLRGIILVVFGFILFLFNAPPFLIIIIPAIVSWLRVWYYIYRLKNKFKLEINKFLSIKFKLANTIKAYKDSWVFGCLTILTTIASYGDPIVLKGLNFKDYDFGIIGAASRLKGIVSLTGGAILNVIFPKLTQDYSKSPNEFSNIFISIFKPLFLLNLVMCSFLILFSDELIILLFGQEFRDAIPFMILFSVGTITPVLTLLSSAVIATGMEKKILISNIIINGINPVLKLVFIPLIGTIFIGWYEAILPWISILIFFIMLKSKLLSSTKVFYTQLLVITVLLVLIPSIFKEYIGNNIFGLAYIILITAAIILGMKFINLRSIIKVVVKH